MLDKIKKLFSRHLPLMLVALSYLFFTVYYMGPSVWHCNDTMYGFGDNTAGPVWRFGLEPKQAPLGSFGAATNYPVGENLYSPVNYSLSGQSYLIWGASRVVGPKCGYNFVNMLGFTASALVMFGFIYSLTKNKWIGWLAGYAVSFSPYYQMKVGGHPGYGFQALLIGVAWAFFNLIKKQRKRDVFYLGSLLAACFYFDPYFSILAVSIVGPLLLTWGALLLWKTKKQLADRIAVLNQLRLVALSLGAFLVLLAPLAAITLSHGKEISESVASSRGNVLFEANACSNLPHEYALPFVLHPIFGKLFGKGEYARLIDRMHDGFTCGIGEDTVGISLVVISITTMGLIIFAWEVLNKRRIKLSLGYDKKLVILGLLAIGLVGLIVALPPIRVAHRIPTPSYVLLMITSTWRTLTRFYVVVNFATIGLFAVVMTFFATHFNEYRKWLKLGFCLTFFIIFVEYQAFRPFSGNNLSTFSYQKDVPSAYQWLKDQKDIHEVAEYPLERSGGESNAMAYYLSMQVAHRKTLFNGNIPTSREESIRLSLKDISDQQTQAVLYSLGIDAVIIHGIEEKEVRKIPGLEVLYSAPQATFNLLAFTPLVKNDNTIIVRLVNQKAVQKMITFEKGFVRNATVIKSAADWEYEALNDSVMRIVTLPGQSKSPDISTRQCFAIRLAAGDNDSADLNIAVDGKEKQNLKLSAAYQRIQLDVKDSITLSNSKGYNMRVKDLGCNDGEL
jgi:hypothetical protein